MLKKLDWYIIKKYLSTFFFTALIISMISVIIDFSDKVEDFIEEPVTVWEIIRDYYLNFLPYINSLLWPLYALIAVVFFTSRMAFNSEIISILNAGISFRRLMVPYLVGASVVAGLHLVGNHIVIPQSNKVRLDFEHTYIWKYDDKGKKNDVHLFISPGTKVYIRYYKKAQDIARDFKIEKIVDNKLVYLLKANTAKWMEETRKWRLKDYEVRTFDGIRETIELGMGKHIDTTLNLTPDDFVMFLNQKEMMDTKELRKFISVSRERGVGNTKVYEVEIHRRTAEPFTIFILTIIGMAVAARKVRGGMGLHLAIGISIGAIYIFLSKFSITFATNESLPPLIGVWVPNIIFTIVAIILVRRAQK